MILTKFFGWLGGGIIGSIGKQLNNAYQAKLTAKNSAGRIEADKTNALVEARRSVIVAEQGRWLTCWIRPALALPFVIYNLKEVVWVKSFGFGTEQALSPELMQLQMLVFGAFLLGRPFEKRSRA